MARLIAVLLLIPHLTGCGSDGSSDEPAHKTYLVAGQSNALVCNWAVFEYWAKATVINIALGGRSIDSLISMFDPESIKGIDFDAVIFIHGESDSIEYTHPPYYIERVNYYRELIGVDNLPFIVSTVGQAAAGSFYQNNHYPLIRAAQREQENWIIAYDDAWQFEEWGLLIDDIHFSREGCELIMDGIYNASKNI